MAARVPLTLTQLYQLIQLRGSTRPNAVALSGEHELGWRSLSGRDVLDLVDRVAQELADAGVRTGDRVVLWVPNGWRTPIFLFGLWKLGAVAVPFDRETNPDAGARIIELVEPRLVLLGYDDRPLWSRHPGAQPWWEPGSRRLQASATAWTPPAEELAAIFFTSGTTGQPKGCMISHRNLTSQVQAAFERIPIDGSCRLASILPLSHLFELTCGLLYPMAAGASVHYVPSRRPQAILRVLTQQRITHMMAVPQLLGLMGRALDQELRSKLPERLYTTLNRSADRLPFDARRYPFWLVHRKLGGHLRMIAVGGAALPPDTQRQWERMGIRVVQGYGTSECSPIVACGAADGSTPIGSVGRPLPGVEIRLTPEGELEVHGPNVMRGYWKDPARTAEVLHDGWYSTGDLASIDRQGNIFLAGRARDLIVLPSGLKVWPSDVEELLRAEPGVRDAAVIAVPSASGGARLHAYLLAEGSRDADPAGIVALVNGRLAQHQRVASASWWPDADFPRTSMLKVRRHLLPLPSELTAVAVESTRAADDPVGQAIAVLAGTSRLSSGQTLGDLGIDSLGLVDLALALEDRTDKQVRDHDLRLDMTVDQVRTTVARAPARDEAVDTDGTVPAAPPDWPYTWGRALRPIALPFALLYAAMVPRTIVIGGDRLRALPAHVIFAGTHHSFADIALVRQGLLRTPAHAFANRLLIAAGAGGSGWDSPWARYAVLAFGLYPLQQERAQDESLRALVRLAEAGNAVLIFPQGTHARPSQERAGDPAVRFRPGVAHLASSLDAVVVPFGLAGTEALMPPFLEQYQGPVIAGVPVSFTRTTLAIAFGTPLAVEPNETAHAFVERLQAVAYALTREAEAARAESAQAPGSVGGRRR
ncbi:MAG: AMP-binding protein [Chloroflexi bacterium]|nr:AMP-binding protein [Chloroflexota bacterium]